MSDVRDAVEYGVGARPNYRYPQPSEWHEVPPDPSHLSCVTTHLDLALTENENVVVLVQGPQGVGKTHLALCLGYWWLESEGARAAAYYIPSPRLLEPDTPERLAQLNEEDRQTLLLIDDTQLGIEICGEIIESFLAEFQGDEQGHALVFLGWYDLPFNEPTFRCSMTLSQPTVQGAAQYYGMADRLDPGLIEDWVKRRGSSLHMLISEGGLTDDPAARDAVIADRLLDQCESEAQETLLPFLARLSLLGADVVDADAPEIETCLAGDERRAFTAMLGGLLSGIAPYQFESLVRHLRRTDGVDLAEAVEFFLYPLRQRFGGQRLTQRGPRLLKLLVRLLEPATTSELMERLGGSPQEDNASLLDRLINDEMLHQLERLPAEGNWLGHPVLLRLVPHMTASWGYWASLAAAVNEGFVRALFAKGRGEVSRLLLDAADYLDVAPILTIATKEGLLAEELAGTSRTSEWTAARDLVAQLPDPEERVEHLNSISRTMVETLKGGSPQTLLSRAVRVARGDTALTMELLQSLGTPALREAILASPHRARALSSNEQFRPILSHALSSAPVPESWFDGKNIGRIRALFDVITSQLECLDDMRDSLDSFLKGIERVVDDDDYGPPMFKLARQMYWYTYQRPAATTPSISSDLLDRLAERLSVAASRGQRPLSWRLAAMRHCVKPDNRPNDGNAQSRLRQDRSKISDLFHEVLEALVIEDLLEILGKAESGEDRSAMEAFWIGWHLGAVLHPDKLNILTGFLYRALSATAEVSDPWHRLCLVGLTALCSDQSPAVRVALSPDQLLPPKEIASNPVANSCAVNGLALAEGLDDSVREEAIRSLLVPEPQVRTQYEEKAKSLFQDDWPLLLRCLYGFVQREELKHRPESVAREWIPPISIAAGEAVCGRVRLVSHVFVLVEIAGGPTGKAAKEAIGASGVAFPLRYLKRDDAVQVQVLKPPVHSENSEVELDLEILSIAGNPVPSRDDQIADIEANYPVGSEHHGRISAYTPYGAFVDLQGGTSGLIHGTLGDDGPDQEEYVRVRVDTIRPPADGSRIRIGLKLVDDPLWSVLHDSLSQVTGVPAALGIVDEDDPEGIGADALEVAESISTQLDHAGEHVKDMQGDKELSRLLIDSLKAPGKGRGDVQARAQAVVAAVTRRALPDTFRR